MRTYLEKNLLGEELLGLDVYPGQFSWDDSFLETVVSWSMVHFK